jgi:RND superfamily putative drug exporter
VRRLTQAIIRRPLATLLSFVALVGLSAIGGLQVFPAMQSAGYSDPNSDSSRVVTVLKEDFGDHPPELAIIVDFNRSADDPESEATTTSIVEKLSKLDGIDQVATYYSLGRPDSLKSIDGEAAYVFVTYTDTSPSSRSAETKLIETELGTSINGADIHYTGLAAMANALNESIAEDLALAESIAIPLSLILLIFVFGSVVAAGLPLLVSGLGILGSFFFIWLATLSTDVSIFALNLITGMGLGLGIDYSLLIVSRFREERASGKTVADAVSTTMATAGRTVLFSGLTVAVVTSSMILFPQYFLRSFAFAGIAVVGTAVAGALIALPAVLTLLGDRVNAWRVVRRPTTQSDNGGWATVSRFVMKHAVLVLVVTLTALGALIALGSSAKFGLVDERILPADAPIAVASEIQRERFDGQEAKPVEMIATGASDAEMATYVEHLSKLTHIVRVQSPLGVTVDGVTDSRAAPAFAEYADGDAQRIVAIHDVEPRSSEGVTLTTAIRAIEHPFDVLVGGIAADYADSLQGIANTLPWVILWIALSTFILLFLFTGSILLPIKAVALNLVSLLSTLGLMTWVFLEGHLSWLLGGFTITGSIDASMFILIAVVTFALSMDYELFLLSRIKEQHDLGLSTTESVAIGLQRSGRIITAAALVLAVNFLPFVTSGVSTVKMLGLGIAFAILLDATVVRALLVPALMKLFGDANWWAPTWMKRIAEKAGLAH